MTLSFSDTRPTRAEDVSSIVHAANQNRTSLVPWGGGTATSIGNGDPVTALALDLSGLAGISSYKPADLTLSVGAGTLVSDVMAELAVHGQELPVDVSLPTRATIGGLVATGFAGPRRLGSGTLKDLILGCSYVRGDGLIAKAGGSVVKNVSGFEIPRLLHGSWGSLAILTSINFKVTPIPKAEVTLRWSTDSIDQANEQALTIRTRFASVVATEIDRTAGDTSLLVRLMGRPGALNAQTEELGDLFGRATTLMDTESRAFWQVRIDRFSSGEGLVQVTLATRPRFVAEAAKTSISRLGLDDASSSVAMSPGIGSARFRFGVDAVDPLRFWSMLDVTTLPGNASAIVEFAPESWKSGIDVWGSRPDGVDVMTSIKTEFDPNNVLNLHRLFI